ncbi:MAG: ATP-binding protein [Candidatus Aenigmarchaeota archaeon]|nr:ATP-binding protein [Candidatus Aenigmarchaeota archaeon]
MYLLREEEHRLFGKLGKKEALALIGPRRAGKTTLAKRLLEDWEQGGKRGAFLDLELPAAPQSGRALAAEIRQVPAGGLAVLDEVQAIPDWVRTVRAEIDAGKRHLLVTGSSASLLSSEVATSLGGRALPETVLPLSYRDARRWGIPNLEAYLRSGGYPECVLRPDDAPGLHKLYLELTVLRDVAARKGVREVKPLADLALLLLSEPGKTLSAKKTAGMLGISQPTFRSFVQGLNDAFLILSVPPYLRSPRERLVADAKHYAYDVGLQASVSLSAQEDRGRRLENLVAVELVRRGYALSYLAGQGWECDFIAQQTGAETLAVQVWSGEGKLPERELLGLQQGMKLGKGLLLSEAVVPVPKGAVAVTIETWLKAPPR